MKDLKSLLFKDENSNHAIAFIQSLEQLIQNGNDITKEQFENILNSMPKDLLNEKIDINRAYSQFITEFIGKDKLKKDEQKDDNKANENEIISKVFYTRIEKTCLNQNLTFTQTIKKIKEIEKDYHEKYHEKFPFVEKQIKNVDQLIGKLQITIASKQQEIKSTINKDIEVQSLSTPELEKKIADEITKNLDTNVSDKVTKALLEKGKAQIIDTIIREIRPIEGIKRTIQNIKMNSQLREIDKIDKIIELMKLHQEKNPEFEEEIKKLEGIKETYNNKKEVLADKIFTERLKIVSDIEDKKQREEVIKQFNDKISPTLAKKFTPETLKTEDYKNLLDWENSSQLIKELSEDVLKASNLEGLKEIEKIEKYIQFYKNQENNKNAKEKLEELEDIYQSYIEAKKDISNSIRKAIEKDETFENLNSRGKNRKINQLIDGNLKLYEPIKVFDLWDNPEQLNKELKEDINKEILNPEVKNKGKDINKWKKALMSGLGFATGIGLEIVLKTHPVLGTVATAYTLARTVYNTAKLTCSISTKINKGNEPKIISGIKSFIPNKVQNIAKTIFEKPNNPYFRSFVNGLSLGYTSANIYHRFIAPQPDTTVTVVDKKKLTASTPTKTTPTPTPNQSPTTTPKVSTTIAPTTPTPSVTDTSTASNIVSNASTTNIPTFETGNVMDISEIEYGYAGPGQSAVHLLNNRGINAVVDKSRVINGQTWVHFKQANGAGYAWFPKEEVEEMFANVSSGRTR